MKFGFFTDFLIFGAFFCVVGRFWVACLLPACRQGRQVVCGLWFGICNFKTAKPQQTP